MLATRSATDYTLPPACVLRAAYDFGPVRTRKWPAVHAEHCNAYGVSDLLPAGLEGWPHAH